MPCGPGFKLISGYPTFDISGQGEIRGIRRGTLPWDELDAFVNIMMPTNTVVGGVMFAFLGAEFPGRPYLHVTGMNVKPYVDRSVAIDFNNDFKHDFWDVTIQYEFIKNEIIAGGDPVPFLIHRWSVGGDVFQADNQGCAWDNIVGKGLTLPAQTSPATWNYDGILHASAQPREMRNGPRIISPHIEHEITWPRVPKPPFTAMKNLVGKTNSQQMTFATGPVKTECLLYNGSQVEMTALSNGERAWNLTHRFSERQVDAEDQNEPGGWNHFYRSATPSTVTITNSGTPPDQDFCTGISGFYRLEKQLGIVTTCSPDAALQPYTIGYNDSLAIFKRRNFADLFKPEPIGP